MRGKKKRTNPGIGRAVPEGVNDSCNSNEFEAPMNAIDMLKKQHREVKALFREYEKQGDRAELTKQQIFEEAADALAIHAAIEEKHFYPAVKAKRTEDILLEALEEHLGIKRIIADMLEIDSSDETFDAKMKALTEQVEHHAGEEEEDLFPKVKKILDPAQLEALGDQMQATMEELQEKGEPRKAVPGETASAAHLS